MKSDGIERYTIDENAAGGHTTIEEGPWCKFKQVEALVDSITRQRDIYYRDLEALKDENALVDQYRLSAAHLMAFDIKKVLATHDRGEPVGASHDRLRGFMKAVGLRDE